MIDSIQINKLSHLHDGEKIFFGKRDYIFDLFKQVENLPNEVILITGNSDYVIDDYICSKIPKNVKFLFSPNNLSTHEKVITLPLGLDNCNISKLGEYHGVGYGDNCQESHINKFSELNLSPKIENLVYCNFTVNTNFFHRNPIKEICKNISHVTVEYSNISTVDFYKKILSHNLILCPSGNGPDTHRFYETLYLGKIPVVFNKKLYEDIYKNFPCVFINDINLLSDYDFLSKKVTEINNKPWDKTILYCDYWKNKIMSLV